MFRSFRPAKKCSGTRFHAPDCVWLVGLDFRTTLTSRHWASDQLTMARFAAHVIFFFFLSRLAASICVMWCWNLWHLGILGRSSYIFPWLKLLHRQPDFDQERERESLAWAMFEISWLNEKLALDRDLLLLCEWFRSTLRRGREKGG